MPDTDTAPAEQNPYAAISFGDEPSSNAVPAATPPRAAPAAASPSAAPAEAPLDNSVHGNPYAKIDFSLNDTLNQNPQVVDHLSNWAKFAGHGITTGIAETLGLPIDIVNSATEFVKNYPTVEAASKNNMLFAAPYLLGKAAKAIKKSVYPKTLSSLVTGEDESDKPIYTGSTKSFEDIANRPFLGMPGLPTSRPEEDNVSDWAANLGADTGELLGTNVPFAAFGVAKEAQSVGTSLARKAWNVFYHEAVPAASIATGEEVGENAIPGDEGKTIGAVAGSLRLSAVKAAFSGVRSAKDWVTSLVSTKPRIARNLAEAATDLPKGLEKLDNQPEFSPGAKFPTDILTEDVGTIALVRTVRDRDRDLAGLYDEQHKTNQEAALADTKYSDAEQPEAVTHLRDKMRTWTQLAHRRVQQAVEEAQRAFETAVGNANPNAVDAEKYKHLQSTLARGYLLEAREDMHAVTDAKWLNVDKSVAASLDPVYDEIGAIKKEHKERPGQAKESFPQDIVDNFFEKETVEGVETEIPKFGPEATLQTAVDLDANIHRKIGEAMREAAPDRVRIAYLTRLSKALQKVKAEAPGGAALKEANAATKDFHDTFSKGPVGNILGHDQTGYDSVTPGNTISHAITQGTGGIDSFGAFMRAIAQKAGGTPAPEFLERYLRQDFYTAAMPGGNFSLEGAQQWLRNNTGPLGSKGFEKLRQDVESAIKSKGESIVAGASQKLNATELKKHAVALFLKDPGRLFSKAMHSVDQYAETRKLLDLTEADPSGRATSGLIQMSLNRMIKDAYETDHLTPEMMHLDGRKVYAWFNQNSGLIKALDQARPGVGARFKRVAETLRKNELNRLRPEVPGITEKAGIIAINDVMARIGGAKLFTKLFGGHGGASLIIASTGSQTLRRMLENLKPDDAVKVLSEAMTDPKFYKALIKGIRTEAEAAQQMKVFEPYWVSMQIPLIQSALTQPSPAAGGQTPTGPQ